MSAASDRTEVREAPLIETARPFRGGRDATPRAGTSLTGSVSETWNGDLLGQRRLSVPPTLVVGPQVDLSRRSTDEQDLTAQRQRLAELGVNADWIYLDLGRPAPNAPRLLTRKV